MTSNEPVETAVSPWVYLVVRNHSRRRQLYLKGRNLTVWQLIGSVRVNRFTDEQAAANYALPLEAIREAFAYAEANQELLEAEAAQERALLRQREKQHGTLPVF